MRNRKSNLRLCRGPHSASVRSKRLNTLPYPTVPYHTLQYNTITVNSIQYYTLPYHTLPVCFAKEKALNPTFHWTCFLFEWDYFCGPPLPRSLVEPVTENHSTSTDLGKLFKLWSKLMLFSCSLIKKRSTLSIQTVINLKNKMIMIMQKNL